MVPGDLGEHALAQQVDPGVPDVEDDPGRSGDALFILQPGQDDAGDRRAGQVGGVRWDGDDRLLGGHHRVHHRLHAGDTRSGQRVEGVEGDLRGHATGGVPAHAVDDDEGRRDGEVAVLVDRAQASHVGGCTNDDPGDTGRAVGPDRGGIGVGTNVLGHRLPFTCVACTPLVNPSAPS